MNRVFNSKNRNISAKFAAHRLQISRNAIALVLLVFVAVAAMQAVQLGGLLADAKSVSNDVSFLHSEQQQLRAQYTAYQNNLSYYFE